MNEVTLWSWLTFRQDYAWFLVGTGWLAALAARYAFGRRTFQPRWLPWAAVVGALTALLEMSQMVVPMEQHGEKPPWLPWDLALGSATALLAFGWWWEAARGGGPARRAACVALAALSVVLAFLRYSYPLPSGTALLLLIGSAAFVLVRSAGAGRRGEKLAIAALAASQIWATSGPVAELLHMPHRFTAINPMGPVAAGSQLVALAACAAALLASLRAETAVSDAYDGRSEMRRLVRGVALWIGFGALLTEAMGFWARESFERSLLSRAVVSSKLIDRSLVTEALGPKFQFTKVTEYHQDGGGQMFAARIADLPPSVLQPLIQSVSAVQSANPDISSAFLVTHHDGWVANFWPSTLLPNLTRFAGLYGRITARDSQRWNQRRAEVIGPVRTYYGSVVQARAPLISTDGKMLGWLTFDLQAARWVAAQVQVRLLAFAVVALGVGVLILNWRQTQRERQREAARRTAESAAAANKLKTEFLAKVSHELRTPLQSVIGYCELLRHSVKDSKGGDWLAALSLHGELMTRLVNDLIDLSALESGSFTLAPKAVCPGDLVAQTVELLRARAEEKGLSLAVLLDSALPSWVALDGERLRQVAINLIGNALKFTDRGGVTVWLTLEESGADAIRLILKVRDTGPGISPSDQGRLFSVFSRLEATASKEGSGLGLALSAALCRKMGGGLTVESDGRTGSCFTGTVSAILAVPPAEAVPPEYKARLRGCRILIVDDNPLVRELFVAFLAEQGAVCAADADGTSALTRLRTDVFDAAIIDLSLPGVNGAEVVRVLRAPGHLRHPLRIVGVSAHATSVDRFRAMEAGMDAFLVKPVQLADLAAALSGFARANGYPAAYRPAEALRRRLMQQFQDELPGQQAELQAAVDASDWAAVRLVTHYLKNSATAVADDVLYDACTGLEAAAAALDGTAVRRNWPRCAEALARWPKPQRINPSSAFTPSTEASKSN